MAARKSGLTDFYVMTGYNGDKIRKHLDRFSEGRDIHITNITNQLWQKGNGIPSSGKKPLHERFMLLMGEHFFEESIPMRIKNERAADGEVLVAVDHNIETVDTVRGNDSTKVLVEEGEDLGYRKEYQEI